jgi:hypothetical protein
MKKLILSLLIFGAIVSADPVHSTFIGVSQNPAVVNGDLAGPYYLQTYGNTFPIMCINDDLTVYFGEQYPAYITPIAGPDFSHTYLGNSGEWVDGVDFTSQQIYQAEAYLFSKIIAPGADTGDIQLAAWAIRDANTFANLSTTSGAYGYILDAYYNAGSFDSTGYQIISDVNHSAQEFICNPADAAVPEPGTLGLLGGSLAGLGALRFAWRKKRANNTPREV